MAVLSSTNLTLADWAKRTDPEGRVPVIAELLSQSNEILEDCVFKEGNLPTGERVVIRTGLPAVYWRALNQGIPNAVIIRYPPKLKPIPNPITWLSFGSKGNT